MGTSERRVSVKSGRSKLVKWDDFFMEKIPILASDIISRAAKTLIDGHLVAFPTETVYGLGADATNEKAVSRIFKVKGRPSDHPLIVHIPSSNLLDIWARDIPDYARALAREFWPGPMTLVLKRNQLAKDFITGGQESVGLRVPSQSDALNLLITFEKLGGFGIAAPSANKFGAVSPTTAIAVKDELGNSLDFNDLILDGGSCSIGIESTIINCTEIKPSILRSGAITKMMIEDCCDFKVTLHRAQSEIKSPGMLLSHYSPKAKVVLNDYASSGDGFLAMANIPTPNGALRLAAPSTIEDFARVLYSAFRLGDMKKLNRIVVFLPPGEGLIEAIKDRVTKAATSI